MSRPLRMTEQDLRKFEANSGRGLPKATRDEIKRLHESERKPPQRAKVKPPVARNSVATVVDGMRFDSKLEARRYGELKLLVLAGKIQYFLRQVPFWLPGNITYRLDFLIVNPISTGAADVNALAWRYLTYEDCKGYQDRVSEMKIRQVEELYGIKIQLVKSARK